VISYIPFLRQRWPLLAFGFATVFWGNFGQSFFIGWFGADIQQSLGLSASAYGSAYSGATLLSAFAVAWLGGLIDRVPLRRFVLLACLGLACAGLLLWQASQVWLLVAGLFLLRLFGQSLLPHTGMTTMARSFDADRGKAISLSMSAVPVGEVLLPLLAVLLIRLIGWQATFLLVALSAVLILLPLLLWLLRRAEAAEGVSAASAQAASAAPVAGTTVISGRRLLLSDRRYWLALPALLASPFLMTGIFIHQNFIVASKGWTLDWLATCFVVYGITHWLASLSSGVLVDRFKARRLLPFIGVPLLLALLLLAFVPGWWVALGLMVLLGLGAGASPPITGALWAEVYGTHMLGEIRSVNITMSVLSTAVAPVLFGVVIDAGGGHALLFGACAAYVAIASALLYFSYPRN